MRMDARLDLICLLFLLVEPVTLDVSVVGYVGGDVVLPCSHSVALPKEDITFRWRFEDSMEVYSFVNGENVSDQDKQFENRATPSALQKGDYSLTLTNLRLIDSGRYTCFVPRVQSQHVELTIKVEEVKPSPEPKIDPGNSSVKIGPQNAVFLLILMFISGLTE